MKQAYLECGKIINTHGFRGTVKLESWCDTPQILASLKRIFFLENGSYRRAEVLHASVFKQFVLMDLEGVSTEDAANALRNTVVYAAREDLPLEEGDFFIVDLLGLPIRHIDTGEELGTLKNITTQGASDLYYVQTPHGEALLPAVPEFVIRIDPDDAIYVRPIPGLLDGKGENV
jgi:16S rRNA processing protein RimM